MALKRRVDAALAAAGEETVRVNITLTRTTLALIDGLAVRAHRSRSAYLASLARDEAERSQHKHEDDQQHE